MAYDFFQENPDNVKGGDTPGHDALIYIGLYSKFTTIAVPSDTPSAEGDTLIITDDHIFGVDDGFVKMTGFRDGAEVKTKSVGEEAFQTIESELELFNVGDHAPLKEKLLNYMNQKVVVLYRDPVCGSTRVQQLGNKCEGAIISMLEGGSGNKKGGKKGFTIKFKAFHIPLDYQGDITLQV